MVSTFLPVLKVNLVSHCSVFVGRAKYVLVIGEVFVFSIDFPNLQEFKV